MKYTLQQLRESFNYVENCLKDMGIEEIELSEDWYWNIEPYDKFNMYDIPTIDNKTINVGSLCDDIGVLDQFVADNVPFHSNLSRLASILQYLEHHIEKND